MNLIMEKEVRGALTKKKADAILEYAKSHGWKCHSYKQVSIYCNTDHIESIGTVSEGKGRLILDMRDDVLKIKIKLGNALNFEREEYSIKCTNDSATAVAVLLRVLGVEEGFVRTFDRTDYVTSNGIQLTVKLNCLMGDHFELERNSDSNDVVETYNSIIDELQLKLWTKEELAKAIQNDHERVTAQNIYDMLQN